jgi:hypothetical protein
VPDVDDVNTIGPVPLPPPPWWKDLFSFRGWPGLIIGSLIGLALLWVLIPPMRVLLKALANLLAAIVDRITSLIRPR